MAQLNTFSLSQNVYEKVAHRGTTEGTFGHCQGSKSSTNLNRTKLKKPPHSSCRQHLKNLVILERF